MHEVLHTDGAELAKGALHQVVEGDGGAVASDLRRENWLCSILSNISWYYR